MSENKTHLLTICCHLESRLEEAGGGEPGEVEDHPIVCNVCDNLIPLATAAPIPVLAATVEMAWHSRWP